MPREGVEGGSASHGPVAPGSEALGCAHRAAPNRTVQEAMANGRHPHAPGEPPCWPGKARPILSGSHFHGYGEVARVEPLAERLARIRARMDRAAERSGRA